MIVSLRASRSHLDNLEGGEAAILLPNGNVLAGREPVALQMKAGLLVMAAAVREGEAPGCAAGPTRPVHEMSDAVALVAPEAADETPLTLVMPAGHIEASV